MRGTVLPNEVEIPIVAGSKPIFVRFRCPHCGAQLQARKPRSAAQCDCPHCGRRFTVPASGGSSAPAGAAHQDNASAAQPDVNQLRKEDLSRDVTYIPVICSVCQTRMYGTDALVGRHIRCPDCGARNLIPEAPSARRSEARGTSTSAELEDDEPLELEPPIERTPVDVPGTPDVDTLPQSAAVEVPEPVELPRWPLLRGIFGFWFYRGSRLRWFALSAVAAAVLALLSMALALGAIHSFATLVGSMFFAAITIVLAIGWIVFMAAHSLAILHDTSYGYDDVVNWPGAVWLDWALQAFYIINSLAISSIIGVGTAAILNRLGYADKPIAAAVVFACFPIVLLSMLEARSCFVPITVAVFRAVFRVAWAWAIFYLEAAVIAAVMVGAVWMALHAQSAIWAASTGPIIVAALMVYFRLLGRLAQVCDAKMAEAPQTKESSTEA